MEEMALLEIRVNGYKILNISFIYIYIYMCSIISNRVLLDETAMRAIAAKTAGTELPDKTEHPDRLDQLCGENKNSFD